MDPSTLEHNPPPIDGIGNAGDRFDCYSHYTEEDSHIDASLPSIRHMPDHYQV